MRPQDPDNPENFGSSNLNTAKFGGGNRSVDAPYKETFLPTKELLKKKGIEDSNLSSECQDRIDDLQRADAERRQSLKGRPANFGGLRGSEGRPEAVSPDRRHDTINAQEFRLQYNRDEEDDIVANILGSTMQEDFEHGDPSA